MDCRAITILAALLTFAASGAEIRHEAFDGKLPADLDARQARFVKGVRGQAVVFDDIASGKRVPCMGCKLTAEKGSVSCWINLQDYRGSDPGCAIFFSADSPEGGRIILYKPQPKRLLFLYNLGRQVARIYSDIRNWQPGKWHHIAATWDHEVMLFYVDGNLVGGATRPAVGKGTLDNMALGTLKFPNESGHTAIDELRLYSEALTAAEVSRLYYADAGKSLLDVSAPLTFRVGASYGTISQDGEIGTHEYASVFPGGFNENGAAADVQAKWHFSATENGFCGAVRAPARFSSLAVTFIGADNRPRTVRFEAGKSLDRDGIRAVSRKHREETVWEFFLPLSLAKFRLDLELVSADGDVLRLSPLRSSGDAVNFAMVETQKTPLMWQIRQLGNVNEGKVDFSAKVPSGSALRVRCRNVISRRRTDTTIPAAGADLTHKRGYGEDGEYDFILTNASRNILWKVHALAEMSSPVSVHSVGADRVKRELVFHFRKRAGHAAGTMRFALVDPKTKRAAVTQDFAVPAGQLQWERRYVLGDISGLYDLEVTHIGARGRKAKTYRQSCAIPGPGKEFSWMNNTFGITPGEVPPPWKPIEKNGLSLKFLAQDYAWGNAPFPSMLVAGGRPLFREAPRMILNGQTVGGKWETLSTAPEIVKMRFTADADGMKISALVTAEFDGFLWYDIVISGAEKTAIRDLRFLFPLEKEFSLMAVNNRRGEHMPPEKGGNGPIPAAGWFGELYKLPAVWVGGNSGGLSFTAETLKNWSLKDKKDTFRVKPGKAGADVVVTLVDRPVVLGKAGRKYAFGLQGTPTKNAPGNFGLVSMEMDWTLTGNSAPGQRYFNGMYHESFNFNAEARRKEVLRKMGQKNTRRKHVFYTSVAGTSPYCPDWIWWGSDFVLTRHGELGRYTNEYMISDDEARDRKIWTCCCPNSRAYLSYRLKGYKTILDNHEAWLINDLYCDQVGPLFCRNETHGCGWKDEDGVFYPTYNLRGAREIMKRIYTMLRRKLPGAELIYHTTGQASVTPVTGFATGFADGEDTFNGAVARKETYFGLFTPDDFRSTYCGEKWGFKICLIPQLSRSAYFIRPDRIAFWRKNPPEPAAKKAFRHYFGYAAVHNVPIWVNEVYLPDLILAFRREIAKELGAWDTQIDFLPYWESGKHGLCVESSQPDRILLSAYRRAPGKAVMVLFNDTDQKQHVRLKPDFAKLIGETRAALRFPDGTPIPANDKGEYPVDIDGQEFLLIVAGK